MHQKYDDYLKVVEETAKRILSKRVCCLDRLYLCIYIIIVIAMRFRKLFFEFFPNFFLSHSIPP